MKGMRRIALAFGAAALLALSSSLSPGLARGSETGPAIAKRFVLAANRGDFRSVCRLYSRTYLKVSQAECQTLYRWEVDLYGRFDYRIVARRRLGNGHWYVALTRFRGSSFVELARETAGWRIVAGGW